MDRQIVYTNELVYETDFLTGWLQNYIGLGKSLDAILGADTQVNGFACTPTSPASLTVDVAEGQIYLNAQIDPTAYGAIAADTTHYIVKQGIALDGGNFSTPAPGTSGYSINYLIQVIFSETDTENASREFYNSSNPDDPIFNNVAQTRQDLATVSIKAGVAAVTGNQVTPTPDAGNVGLWVITVDYGQTTVTSTDIVAYSGTDFLAEKLKDKISQATADLRYSQITATPAANYFINPLLNISQDYAPGATALTITTGGAGYVADMMRNYSGDGQCDVSIVAHPAGQTDIPGAVQFLRHDQTTVTTSDTPSIQFFIEDVRTLQDEVVTLYVAMKGDSAYVVQSSYQQHFGTGGSATVDSGIFGSNTISTSWGWYSFQITLPSVAGKTIGTRSFLSLSLVLPGAALYEFDLGAVAIFRGTSIHPVTSNGFDYDLQRCKRFYEKSYAYGVKPATVTNVNLQHWQAYASASGIPLTSPTIRVLPKPLDAGTTNSLISIYAPDGTANEILLFPYVGSQANAAADFDEAIPNIPSADCFSIWAASTANETYRCYAHWVFDARYLA